MPDAHARQIYLLSPRDLNPETIAVAFAKTSRSPLSFREIAADLTDEQSAKFHEKYVVGYGHASVAEHAVLHLAFENVSRLAIETIESNRLASYTEKSTRYQKWDPDGYYVPAEVRSSAHEARYRQTCDRLFAAYQASLEPVRAVVRNRLPQKADETEARWDGRIRSRYVDVCRFLLPAAAIANVGMTANARTLEHAIRKMLSHPLEEVREIGRGVKETAQAEVPTLVKYADRVPYLVESEDRLEAWADRAPGGGASDWLELVEYDPSGEDAVLAAAVFRHGHGSLASLRRWVEALSPDERQRVAADVLGRMDRHDIPLRDLEHASYTFDAVIDQGAYFEVKRHRMMTQSPQRLTAELGYVVPRLMADAGFEAEYRGAMAAAQEAYRELAAWNADVAAYLVPNGFLRRVALVLNLREVYHFCELRSAASAHFSVRRLALRMAEEVRRVHPLLAGPLRLNTEEDWRQVEAQHFCDG